MQGQSGAVPDNFMRSSSESAPIAYHVRGGRKQHSNFKDDREKRGKSCRHATLDVQSQGLELRETYADRVSQEREDS